MNTETLVKGIICKKCGNELPVMTMQQHLDGNFNQECPHKIKNLYYNRLELEEIILKNKRIIHIKEYPIKKDILVFEFQKKSKTYKRLFDLLRECNLEYSIDLEYTTEYCNILDKFENIYRICIDLRTWDNKSNKLIKYIEED